MVESVTNSVHAGLVQATEVAGEAEVRRSRNGIRFAAYGEIGVPLPDLDSMIEAVPPSVTAALGSNTYFFVPLALRGPEAVQRAPGTSVREANQRRDEGAMVAREYSTEAGERAICHRNVALGAGQQGVFISTRLMGDRFALCFEFFINVAHAFVDTAGIPQRFSELVWEQALTTLPKGAKFEGTKFEGAALEGAALDGAATRAAEASPAIAVRGETSFDAWEARNLALGLPAEGLPQPLAERNPFARRGSAGAKEPMRGRSFSFAASAEGLALKPDEKERANFESAAFSDALAIYLLSLALDFDYADLKERDYPLLAPAALAARLKLVAELFPPNAGYEFAVRYRRSGRG
jgi:hypothetical protein